jgi:hypothetical protein
MTTASFNAAQRAWDNRSDPRLEDDDSSERESWESDLDIFDLLTSDEIDEALWAHLSTQPWFQERLDERWESYKDDCRRQDAEDAAASRAEDSYWEAA